jgi:hypothetical protein
MGTPSRCPAKITDFDNPPQNFHWYAGDPKVFHCGARVAEETCNPSWANDQQQDECVYSTGGVCGDKGTLITKDNLLCGGCAGTPNDWDSENGYWSTAMHIGPDRGGILRSGDPAYSNSRDVEIDTNRLCFGVGCPTQGWQ